MAEHRLGGQGSKAKLRSRQKYRDKNREAINLQVRKRKRELSGWLPGEHEKAVAAKQIATSCDCCGGINPGSMYGWHSDHNHKTNRFRGTLCHLCNVRIGHIEVYLEFPEKYDKYLER